MAATEGKKPFFCGLVFLVSLFCFLIEIFTLHSQDEEKRCLQCKQIKPLIAFSQQKRKADEHRKICHECEQFNQDEKHHRKAKRREMRQQQDREAKRLQEWERRLALRRVYEENWQERQNWYLQQPDRCCQTCHLILPASAFGVVFSSTGFVVHRRCKICHEALYKRLQVECCLCQKKVSRQEFLSHYNGYALSGSGVWISLCCKGCEDTFLSLSDDQKRIYIHSCCERSFPPGQVIYAEVDPVTNEIRYIGRTGQPERRHAQHLCDASPQAGQWGTEKKLWYTRRNWIYALSEKGLTPSMKILQMIEVSPLVVEWEQRYIWHGIQQEWKLLNVETLDDDLVARAQASTLHFLQEPFEILMQHHFFPSHGIAAFLHKWFS